jgi:hypothetical protein
MAARRNIKLGANNPKTILPEVANKPWISIGYHFPWQAKRPKYNAVHNLR